ncbi:PhzF family phenazine biosynthesis protein [Acidipila sp. EB88]|uniref:PhzF family phenazine biosynthesis protein n=1 Tax=Acidipila sp. EB88 TaxID=2305226 RepID=UPI000F5FF2AF|nr:PhzF family phenazine biosynthesis protein [Acidipila sp. EB88]RRA48507.1 PhzF family phenazine biosynthesis protein [Acidipila sp. EB88]
MPRPYPYLLLDVFTDTPFAGNQLAVFPDAHGLTDAEMQCLARETNLSETTFCLPTPASLGGAEPFRVRIFTVDEELPFAGHPTLGTAAALRWTVPALRHAAEVRLALNAGVVPVRYAEASLPAVPDPHPTPSGTVPLPPEAPAQSLPWGQPLHGEMEQPLPRFGREHDRGAVAAALGLPLSALDPTNPVQTVSTGLPFVIVPLSSRTALRALRVPQQLAQPYLEATDGKFFYVIAPGDENERGNAMSEAASQAGSSAAADSPHWYARMQFYGGEDPATGSAAGCATAYLVQHGLVPSGTTVYLHQGSDILRPSTLRCSAVLPSNSEHSGQIRPLIPSGHYVRVAGSTILVAQGRFFLR